MYADVKEANLNPFVHYLKSGKTEGRMPKPEIDTLVIENEQSGSILNETILDQNSEQPGTQEIKLEIEPGAPNNNFDQALICCNGDDEHFVFGLDASIPESIIVGEGTYLLIRGWCFYSGQKIEKLSISIGKKNYPVFNHSIFRNDVLPLFINRHNNCTNIMFCGFWSLVPLKKLESEQYVELTINAILSSGEKVQGKLGNTILKIDDGTEKTDPGMIFGEDSAKVAICMATYNPPMELFKNQIRSLIDQVHKNWICIINDDHSRPEIFDQITSLIGRDERFFVFRNEDRLGHYNNFEASLQRVPENVDFIAFCDQDDEWYPEKLSKSLEAFHTDNDMLVYCDMDIVDQNKNKIANTFWTNRKNNYTSLEVLIFANTVTGAASIFRASLLKEILPFPEKLGDVYHDHWVACVALVKGNIQYIDEPLYAYNQHLNNAYGIQSKNPSYSLFPELETIR